MKLLIKIHPDRGSKAHIPDAQGSPLCQLRLNLADWQIKDQAPAGIVICRACRQVQAKKGR